MVQNEGSCDCISHSEFIELKARNHTVVQLDVSLLLYLHPGD